MLIGSPVIAVQHSNGAMAAFPTTHTIQMKKAFTVTVLTALISLLATSFSQAAPRIDAAPASAPAITQDIASAGRLRLQSQRLAKLWLQAGLGIQPGSANGKLAQGAGEFERSLAELSRYGTKESTQKTFQRINELWVEFRIALSLHYSEGNLQVVNYLADDLMLATGRLTMKIEAEAETGAGRLLDLSMRQNMLAQRLARLTLMAQAGDRSRGRLVDIEQTRKEFATALTELSGARENTPASREALELARMQWMFFDRAISEMSKGGDSRPQHVASTSERILEALDAVSQQYAQDYASARFAATTGNTRRN